MYITGNLHLPTFKGGWFHKYALFEDCILACSLLLVFVLAASLSVMSFTSLLFPPLIYQSTTLFKPSSIFFHPVLRLLQFSHFLPTVSEIKGIINKKKPLYIRKSHRTVSSILFSWFFSYPLLFLVKHCFKFEARYKHYRFRNPQVSLQQDFQPSLHSFLGRTYTSSKIPTKGNSEGKKTSY